MKQNSNNVIPHEPTKLALSKGEVELLEAAFKKLRRNRHLTPVQRKMKSLRIGANARRIYQQLLIANGVRFKV